MRWAAAAAGRSCSEGRKGKKNPGKKTLLGVISKTSHEVHKCHTHTHTRERLPGWGRFSEGCLFLAACLRSSGWSLQKKKKSSIFEELILDGRADPGHRKSEFFFFRSAGPPDCSPNSGDILKKQCEILRLRDLERPFFSALGFIKVGELPGRRRLNNLDDVSPYICYFRLCDEKEELASIDTRYITTVAGSPVKIFHSHTQRHGNQAVTTVAAVI